MPLFKPTLHAITMAASLLSVLAIVAFQDEPTVRNTDAEESIHGAGLATSMRSPVPTRMPRFTIQPTSLERQAIRLQRRAERNLGTAPTPLSLIRALDDRKRLLQHSIAVTFEPDDAEAFERTQLRTWELRLGQHPEWLELQTGGSPRFTVNTSAIAATLRTAPQESYPPVHASVMSPVSDGKVIRVTPSAFAHGGFSFDATRAAEIIAGAVHDGTRIVAIPVTHVAARVFSMNSNGAVTELSLLGSGVSDFRGSPLGRQRNIEKALNERVTNIVVSPNAEFSFNDALGQINVSDGWKEGLAIFGGGVLAPVPGGGICQAATTLYRAAVLAGLPILKRKSHSLYVTYYEKYGVGIDATVFPGQQDLVLKNDTEHDLLIQSATEGTTAYVNIYGAYDGRKVAVEGPYFSSTAPSDLLVNGKRKIARNEIAWTRTISKGGVMFSDMVVSKYKTIPKKLASDHPHAAAYSLE